MNPRYVLVLAAFLLFAVGEIAGEGGPIDGFAQGGSSGDPGELTEPRQIASASPQPSAGFFSDYEPDSVDVPEMLSGPPGPARTFRPRTSRNPSLGALSKEQLNVEEPVGLASMREDL